MRALVQRVTNASVAVGPEEVGRIGPGLVVLLGIAQGDAEPDADYLTEKLVNLRIFADAFRVNSTCLPWKRLRSYWSSASSPCMPKLAGDAARALRKLRAPMKPNAFTNTWSRLAGNPG